MCLWKSSTFDAPLDLKMTVFISKWVNELITSKASTGTVISRTMTIPGGDKCPYSKGRSISKAGRG